MSKVRTILDWDGMILYGGKAKAQLKKLAKDYGVPWPKPDVQPRLPAWRVYEKVTKDLKILGIRHLSFRAWREPKYAHGRGQYVGRLKDQGLGRVLKRPLTREQQRARGLRAAEQIRQTAAEYRAANPTRVRFAAPPPSMVQPGRFRTGNMNTPQTPEGYVRRPVTYAVDYAAAESRVVADRNPVITPPPTPTLGTYNAPPQPTRTDTRPNPWITVDEVGDFEL